MADSFYEQGVESVSFFMRTAPRRKFFCVLIQEAFFTMTFNSILFARSEDRREEETLAAPDCFPDLNLDQIVDTITADKQDYRLTPFFYTPLHDIDAVLYRHEVIRDLENSVLFEHIQSFARKMRTMREYLALADKLYYKYQKERWFLDAVDLYCDAMSDLARDLSQADVQSRGFIGFRDYVIGYINAGRFPELLAETKKLKADLSTVKYCLRIRGNSINVRKYDSESDYSVDVAETFEKFKQGAIKDYWVKFSNWSEMNHIEAQILDMVARLYPDIFANLDEYRVKNDGYLNETIATFDREIQFYLAYLEYMARFKRAGLSFCYPRLSEADKEVYDHEGFDAALATKLLNERAPIVCNDFFLRGKERIVVITGPNQGGKTTFARMFGQLHYLASLGCPVPGREAQLFLCDQLFTHFEKEETIKDLRGKLQDDLMRIATILDRSTSNSIIIMNEIFTSTTLSDALFLSKKILERMIQMDSLGICVTFIDELSTLSEKTVSMTSMVVPKNPAQRTYKVVRRPADGLAYAIAIAEKYRLTYKNIKERISS